MYAFIMARVIGLLNLKGGSGKTTSAVNLALLSATTGKPSNPTALLDLDPRIPALKWIKAGGFEDTIQSYYLSPGETIEHTIDGIKTNLGKRGTIYIDTPANDANIFAEVCEHLDLALLPLNASEMDGTMLEATFKILQRAVKTNTRLKYLLFFSRGDSSPAVTRRLREQLSETYEIAEAIVPDRAYFKELKTESQLRLELHEPLFTEMLAVLR